MAELLAKQEPYEDDPLPFTEWSKYAKMSSDEKEYVNIELFPKILFSIFSKARDLKNIVKSNKIN